MCGIAGILGADQAPEAAVRQMIDTARTLNPTIEAIVRSDNEEEAALLAQDTAARIFLGEEELALNISSHVLKRYGKSI